MKDSDKLFDVVGVNVGTGEIRVMATNLTAESAEELVDLTVARAASGKSSWMPLPPVSKPETEPGEVIKRTTVR